MVREGGDCLRLCPLYCAPFTVWKMKSSRSFTHSVFFHGAPAMGRGPRLAAHNHESASSPQARPRKTQRVTETKHNRK